MRSVRLILGGLLFFGIPFWMIFLSNWLDFSSKNGIPYPLAISLGGWFGYIVLTVYLLVTGIDKLDRE